MPLPLPSATLSPPVSRVPRILASPAPFPQFEIYTHTDRLSFMFAERLSIAPEIIAMFCGVGLYDVV